LYIWILTINNEKQVPDSLLHASKLLLSNSEIRRAERFVRDEDHNRFVLPHAFCRLMLSHFGSETAKQWCFEKEAFGRPYIQPSMNSDGIDFNLSHTSNAIACMLSKAHRVGVDLEACDRIVNMRMFIEKQFSTLEQSQFAGLTEQEQQVLFFKIWTLKEAYIKNTGKGLSEGLQHFGFDLRQQTPFCFLEHSKQDTVNKNERLLGYLFGTNYLNSRHQLSWSIQCDDMNDDTQNQSEQPLISEYGLMDLAALLGCQDLGCEY